MSPEEILMTSIAPLQRSVSGYGDASVALALRDRQRQEQLQDMAIKHQQALQILGLEQAHQMNVQHMREVATTEREKLQNQAAAERGLGLLDERQLLSDTEDVEKRNRERDSLYETAAAYGFKIDPKATPEQNQRLAMKTLEDKAVEGYKNLVAERGKIKEEIDDLLTPKKVSDAEIVKALATDPIVSGVLDKKQLAALSAGQIGLQELAGKLGKGDRETLLSQAETIRAKLEAKANEEQQRKAAARIRELGNRHDELSTAISSAQKSIPAHRLGDIYTGAKDTKSAGATDKKAAFMSDLKSLLGGATPAANPAVPPAALPAPPSASPQSLLMLPPGVGDSISRAGNWITDKVIGATLGRSAPIGPVMPAPPRPNPMMIINPFAVQGQIPPAMPINPQLPIPPELMPVGGE